MINDFLTDMIVQGGIWQTRPIDEVPEIQLAAWQVMKVGEDRHFVGWNMTEREGRVSSKIVEYDPESKRGITRSGRVYQLYGQSGVDGDAMYTWGRWCAIHGITEFTDVSDEA